MSDRIAVMNKGSALQVGSPVEIYERPNCRFVADFIGETNILYGKVKELDKDKVWVSLHKPPGRYTWISTQGIQSGPGSGSFRSA